MMKRSLARACGAAIATLLVSSGLLVGAATSSVRAEEPAQKDVLDCVLSLDLANCLTGDSDLLGSGAVGSPLTLVEPVFGLLPGNLLGLLSTDVTWLCDGVPIPGTDGLTELIPTEAMEGCEVAAQTVTTLLGFLPLTLVTDLVGITGDGEDPDLPASLLSVLTGNPLLTGSGTVGAPLSLATPVFGGLAPALQGLLGTDITWLCDGVPIPGVGSVTQFVPAPAQAGCEIAVKTVTSLLDLLPLELLTNGVDVTEEPQSALSAGVAPRIAKVGGLLSIDPGTWLGGVSIVEPLFAYQWYNTAGAIPGATSREYVPTLADAGEPVAATVTATLTGFLDGLGITNVVRVPKAASTTRLSKAGARMVSFRVTPGAARPTGKVRLMENGKQLRTVRLRTADDGRRTVRLPRLGPGAHRIRAVYLGNTSLKRSSSKALRFTIR